MKYRIEGLEVIGGEPVDSEALLTREFSRELGRMKAKGKIIDYYHRPDRRGGHRERDGVPDFLIALAPGRVGGIELKKGSERATESQIRWLVALYPMSAIARDMGGALWCVSSWREAIEEGNMAWRLVIEDENVNKG